MTREYGIRKGKHSSTKERWQYAVICLVSVIDGLIGALSLGYYVSHFRCYFMFDLFEED